LKHILSDIWVEVWLAVAGWQWQWQWQLTVAVSMAVAVAVAVAEWQWRCVSGDASRAWRVRCQGVGGGWQWQWLDGVAVARGVAVAGCGGWQWMGSGSAVILTCDDAVFEVVLSDI
jgi:hypothetical protein